MALRGIEMAGFIFQGPVSSAIQHACVQMIKRVIDEHSELSGYFPR